MRLRSSRLEGESQYSRAQLRVLAAVLKETLGENWVTFEVIRQGTSLNRFTVFWALRYLLNRGVLEGIVPNGYKSVFYKVPNPEWAKRHLQRFAPDLVPR